MVKRYTEDLQIKQTMDGKRYYSTSLVSEISTDTFAYVVTSQDGDRFDTLAAQYYQDASKWWIIAKANNLANGTMFIPGGLPITIPSAGLV